MKQRHRTRNLVLVVAVLVAVLGEWNRNRAWILRWERTIHGPSSNDASWYAVEQRVGGFPPVGTTIGLSLRVPFYVYENETLNWDAPSAEWNRNAGYDAYKHSDDLWLLRGALSHPMRTTDPRNATMFFVPTLLNLAASLKGKRSKICVGPPGHRACFQKSKGGFYKYADTVLGEQEWFRRNAGKDHVLVASHWNVGPYFGPNTNERSHTKPDLFPSLRACNTINRQGHKPIPYEGRFFLPSCYVGTFCPDDDDDGSGTSRVSNRAKTHDFAMVASLHDDRPDFRSRREICEWLGKGNHSVSVCGPGDQCPALAQARFGFHARGDTWGSNRPMDTFLSRAVPLFTDPAQYGVLPQGLVPWEKLTHLINVSSREAFEDSLGRILRMPTEDYARKRAWIDYYMPIFDHTTIYRFDAYMAAFARLQGYQDD